MNLRNLTREEAIRLHREMWMWMASETVNRQKKVSTMDWIAEYIPVWEGELANLRICCTYGSNLKTTTEWMCKYCPIDWLSTAQNRMCRYKTKEDRAGNNATGLYAKWTNAKTWQEAAELAQQIAELPGRENVNEIQ